MISNLFSMGGSISVTLVASVRASKTRLIHEDSSCFVDSFLHIEISPSLSINFKSKSRKTCPVNRRCNEFTMRDKPYAPLLRLTDIISFGVLSFLIVASRYESDNESTLLLNSSVLLSKTSVRFMNTSCF